MIKTAWVAAAMLSAACSSDDAANQPVIPDARSVVHGVVEYTASTLVMESFPVQLRTEVSMSNVKGAPITVTFPDGCIVLIRVYRDAAMRSLAWDMSRVTGCTGAMVPVSIAAGESKTVATGAISARQILGDSLPNGRYYVRALIRPGGTALSLAAGWADLAR